MAESSSRRPRANTSTFSSSFSWRKLKQEQPVPPALTVPHVLSVEELLHALTPPTVPSPGHARNLASALASCSPLPPHSQLLPILTSLCDPDSLPTLQAAGFDVLSAYWENDEAAALDIADRIRYLTLFSASSVLWSSELWEPRFKALRAFTRHGIEVIGIELPFVQVCKSWVEGAFDGLLLPPEQLDRTERSEREKCVEILSAFITKVIETPEIVARIPDEGLVDILTFYTSLINRAIEAQPFASQTFHSPLSESGSTAGTPVRASPKLHKRNPSSVSMTSLPSPTVSMAPSLPSIYSMKQPLDIAVDLYLAHINSQMKTLTPHLGDVMSLLFRVLAHCSTPLPRLSIVTSRARKPAAEDKIDEMFTNFFSRTYSSISLMNLRHALYPPSTTDQLALSSTQTAMEVSFGAFRTLRQYIRKALRTRLARAYISRESSLGYSHTGAPVHLDLEKDLMEKAWPKDDIGLSGWDAGRLGKVLAGSVGEWVKFPSPGNFNGKERILEEAACILRDVLHELSSRDDDSAKELEDAEATAIGQTLFNLSEYIVDLKNQDDTPYVLPLSQPGVARTPFLVIMCSLLGNDYATNFDPLLSTTLLNISDHLRDEDTARLPRYMMAQHDLTPTSLGWLDNWRSFLGRTSLITPRRPLTKKAVMEALDQVYDIVRYMPNYRRPLADLVFDFAQRSLGCDALDDCEAVWGVLSDEVVNRTLESPEGGIDSTIEQFLDLVQAFIASAEDDDDDAAETESISSPETQSPSPPVSTAVPSTLVSPTLSRVQSDYATPVRDKEGQSGLMSILSSLAAGNSSRSQSIQPRTEIPDPSPTPSVSEPPSVPSSVGAVSVLVSAFSQLAFSPYVLEQANLMQAFRIHDILSNRLKTSKSVRVRLAILQFLMRLRADRDHRLYFIEHGYDVEGQVLALSSLIGRVPGVRTPPDPSRVDTVSELRRARPRQPIDPADRRLSRGRAAGGPSVSTASRSRSRPAGAKLASVTPSNKGLQSIWQIPEVLPFTVFQSDVPSEGIITYDAQGPDRLPVLPISPYLYVIAQILESETSWEILSYVLCHLPTQLANKHLFCGPRSREAISVILTVLCKGIANGTFGNSIDRWPPFLKPRDAHGLAYHTLSVLVSYRRCFELHQRHLLVEVFHLGLSGQPATIKCCLHALSLTAFELQSSTTRYLSDILEKLSQIMSNPDMAVHILGFLSIVGSHSPLYSNFTENEFKMVFGVALQYLQHHNREGESLTGSWALFQHVRILSYSVLYVWFLAVKLGDRPRHIKYIVRQLLLANQGNDEVDSPTEVAFDWLARYTYASADPRPTSSLLSDIVMNPGPSHTSADASIKEKTWILGNSVVTVRNLPRLGWIEVLSRRPSGYTKFICRAENSPFVGPGDVDPDWVTTPAAILMERDPPHVHPDGVEHEHNELIRDIVAEPHRTEAEDSTSPPVPDPVSGYVWSGSAPSQRRKDVAIDPGFFALQLSAYPERLGQSRHRMMVDPSTLPRFIRTLDTMPVIDTHKVGIIYVAPGQTMEQEILSNGHGSPAYTRFLEGMGRLIRLRGQVDVYAGGLDPDVDGEYAYAWWDDIRQILYHTATMMPAIPDDPSFNNKKRHIGNDHVRVVWNDSGYTYRFDTLSTQFQFVNIVIEPHSLGAIAAFSNNLHENEYFKVTVQRAAGMTDFAPVGEYKLISAENLPLLIRQLILLADWFATIFAKTEQDTVQVEMQTNWQTRLDAIRRFRATKTTNEPKRDDYDDRDRIMAQEPYRDFTNLF